MKSKYFLPVFVLVVFGYFLLEFNVFEKLKGILKTLQPEYLLLSLLFYVSTYVFRAARFGVMFQEIRTMELAAVMGVHTFFNNILPFRSGEVSFPLILRRFFGIDVTVSSVALVLARILDLLSLGLLFFTSALFVSFGERSVLWVPLVLFLILGLFLFLTVKLLRRFERRFPIVSTVFTFVRTFVSFKKIALLVGYSLLTWLFKFFSFFSILKGGGIDLTFPQTVFVSTFGEITTILPIHSFGGFGTYEAGLVGGFSLIGLKADYALTVAFYFHVVLLIMSSVLAAVGWIYLWRKR